MRPKRPGRVAARLDVLLFPAASGDLIRVECADCRKPLDLQQPDERDPDRLLGICRACSGWFLIELVPDRSELLMVPLPTAGSLRSESP